MIPIEKEPKEVIKEFTTCFGATMEHCFFCHNKTLFWHRETNTPVCQICSTNHSVHQLGGRNERISHKDYKVERKNDIPGTVIAAIKQYLKVGDETAESVCMEFFGLEPDYIEQLL